MANSFLKIASIGIGVSGAVGGAGTGIYLLSKKETTPAIAEQIQEPPFTETTKPKSKITDLFSGKNLSLIDENLDAGEWTRVFEEFKKDHTDKEPAGIWKIAEWNDKKNEEKGLPELKLLCKKNKDEEVESEESNVYKEVVKYCTKTITGQLGV